MRALEARQAQQGGPAGGTSTFAYGEDDDEELAGSEGGTSSMIVSPRGLGGLRADRGNGPASASALMAAMGGGGGGGGPAMSTRGDSLSAMRASLEQISRVVNGALIATQAAAAAGRPGAYAGGGGGGSYAAPGKPQRGTGGYSSSSALLDGIVLPQQRQQGRSMRAAAPALAWGTEYDGGQYSRQYDETPPGEDGLSFLGRWKDERDVAQALLQQHSSWLRGFREQIGRASSGGGGGGATAGPGGMQQRLSSVAAVGMGGGARGGGSGVGGGGSGAGIPMRIPIGNNQEVVVMVQPQH